MFEVFYYNLEITTLGNISYTGSSPVTEVTLIPNVTEQSTESFTTYSLTTTSTEKSTSSSPTTTALRTTKGQWKILMDKLTYLSKASVLTRMK